MFITSRRRGYDRHGQQVASGRFLVFMQPDDTWAKYHTFSSPEPIRCLVRFCKLEQLGHWMMGVIRVKGQSITVSGTYGSDGLPKTVPREIYELGVPLPPELHEKWNKGGGWNDAGSEGQSIHDWAVQTFPSKIK